MQTVTSSPNGTTIKLIKNLLTKTVSERVLDRTENIDDVARTLQDHWSYDLADRKPGPAIISDGDVKASDMDLSCVAATLCKRSAKIVIPVGVDGALQKIGQLIRLQSNQDYLSFNLLFIDMSIFNAQNGGEMGEPRSYPVIGRDLQWHPRFQPISFSPDPKENAFFNDFGINVGTDLKFDRFTAEGREWNFLSQFYYLTKLVVERYKEEAKPIDAFVKANKPKAASKDNNYGSGGNRKKEKKDVPIFHSFADVEFKGPELTVDNVQRIYGTWQEAEKRLKEINYDILADLTFALRATDYAFYLNNAWKAGFPARMRSAKWVDKKINRTNYKVVTENFLAGQSACDLRLRIRAKTEDVEVK